MKKVLPVVTGALVVVFVAWTVMFSFKAFTTDVGLVVEPEGQALRIRHKGGTLLPKEDFLIPYAEIDRVELVTSVPSMRKVNGLDNSNVRIGAFRADLGDFRAYLKLKEPKYLVIYTSKTIYMVSLPILTMYTQQSWQLNKRRAYDGPLPAVFLG